MFCPHCGGSDQTPKSYCRRCGEWLTDISGRSSPTPEERMKVMIVFNGLSAVMAAFAAIALYSTYLGTPEIKWSIYVAGAFCSVIAVHQMISFGFALELRLRSRRGRKNPLSTAGSVNDEPGRQLDGYNTDQILHLPTVTENTTELLEEAPRQTGVTKPQR